MTRRKFTAKQLKSIRGTNVSVEDQKRIVAFAGKCMRELSKEKYGLPELTKPLQIETKNRSPRACGGYDRILIDVCLAKADNEYYQKGGTVFAEYSAIKDHPQIGSVRSSDPWVLMETIIAHEVAHHIQRRYAEYMSASQSAKMDKPHGEGWKTIYRYLRTALINDRIERAVT